MRAESAARAARRAALKPYRKFSHGAWHLGNLGNLGNQSGAPLAVDALKIFRALVPGAMSASKSVFARSGETLHGCLGVDSPSQTGVGVTSRRGR